MKTFSKELIYGSEGNVFVSLSKDIPEFALQAVSVQISIKGVEVVAMVPYLLEMNLNTTE